ncbi:MAG: N-acetyl-D-Glu racemase DgcA [Pseudomonadota bacterium]
MTEDVLHVDARVVRWPLHEPFQISGYTWETMSVIEVTVRDDQATGLGEGAPLFYKQQTAEGLLESLNPVLGAVSRADVRAAAAQMPGGARNALDCALWDWRARRAGRAVHELIGAPAPEPLTTVMTISLDTPDVMAASAVRYASRRALKLKLGASRGDADRLRAVRAVAPDAELIIDANCGWDLATLQAMQDALVECRVAMVEQPLPPDADEALRGFASAVPLCADESCQTVADVPRLKDRYQLVNIKLDKTGGLTSALELADAAERAGMQMMVGNMVGSSLAMAPAHLIGQRCRFVDLDGPLLLGTDCDHGLDYNGSTVNPPTPALWGGP